MKATNEELRLYYPIRKKDQSVTFEEISVSYPIAVSNPLSLNATNIRYMMRKLIGAPYGWGTYLGNRDCSALVKDFYSVFNIHLPRNSSAQIRAIKTIDITNKTPTEKEAIVRTQALPFLTLLQLQGHIAIYVGLFRDRPLIFHSAWGVTTEYGEKTGRNIIGSAVLSTLHYGEEVPYYSKNDSFLNRLAAIGFIHHPFNDGP